MATATKPQPQHREIVLNGSRLFERWDGKTFGEYGAGSGEPLPAYLAMIEQFKKTKRGIQTVIDAHAHQVEGEARRG